MTINEMIASLREAPYDWYDAQLHYDVANELERLNAKWRSDCPPPVGEKVIVAIHDTSGDTPWDYTTAGWYTGIDNKWIVDDDFCYWVTHWMPFPDPPTRGKRQ